MNQKLIDLQPRITRSAAYNETDRTSADDIAQEIYLDILERAAKNPSLYEQTDAYILWQSVRNGGGHAVRSETRYAAHLQSVSAAADEDGEEMDWYEVTPGSSPDPAEAAELDETLAEIIEGIYKLSPENKQIVSMLYLGYSESEIAAKLGVSRPAITQRKATIRKQLSCALAF